MKIAVLKETLAGENRVAIIPDSLKRLKKKGIELLVESGAGAAAGFADSEYEKLGATIESSREKLIAAANAVIKVLPPTIKEAEELQPDKILISIIQPLIRHDLVNKLLEKRVTSFGLDIIPRTTLAQSMDILSSMSTIAGYKSVLLAADTINKFFPMLMTAAAASS